MTKSIKKLLSLVLAMIMVLSLVPAVSAADTEPEIGGSVGDREPIDETIEWIEIADGRAT